MGKTKHSLATDTTATTHSLIASNAGDVKFTAGNTLNIDGSDVPAANNVTLIANNINIIHTTDSYTQQSEQKAKSSGLTVALAGAVGERMTKGLCIAALQMALVHHKHAAGLILQSDRDGQHDSKDYQAVLYNAGLVPSMSRKGNCWDNAPMEGFLVSLKSELIHHKRFKTRTQAVNPRQRG